MIRYENTFQSIGFDEATGQLTSLYAKSIKREFLSSDTRKVASPLAVWHTKIAPFTLPHRDYLWDTVPPDPGDCFAKRFNTVPTGFRIERGTLFADYTDGEAGIVAHMSVKLDGVKSTWHLTLENTGSRSHEVMPVFPNFSGINLSRETGRMLIMNQSGHVGGLWAHRGGVYGIAFHNSAQFGCLFEGDACLGFYVADGAFGPKDIRYACPSVSVRWFKPATLAPGQCLTLPETVLMVYGGSWKQTAGAYGDWFRTNTKCQGTPEWVRYIDSYTGAWADKKGASGPRHAGLTTAMDSFEELPSAYKVKPFEVLEYAFYCGQSMLGQFNADGNPAGANSKRHTDGVNIVRSDLGGAAALKKGVRAVHKMGRKVVLYIEGLIVPGESKLFEMIPEAKDWLVHNIGGDNVGPYTKDGWVHMCPGCPGWQDHLVDTVVRLIKETGIDGIRLDSLGGYHWHCYNPTHHHESPYDYNAWLLELLGKVARAARAVRPDILLSTEHPIDYYHAHFNHSLHQIIRLTDLTWAVNEASPMRVALPGYKIVYWGGGGVNGSLQLMPDGFGHSDDTECGRLDDCWKSVRVAVAGTLADGDLTMPDPKISRGDVFCRWVRGRGEDVVIGARPVTDINDPNIKKNKEMLLKPDIVETTVSVPIGYHPVQAYLYDIAKQTLEQLSYACDGATVTFTTGSNWFMALLTSECKAAPAVIHTPSSIAAGETLTIAVDSPAIATPVPGFIEINGLNGCEALPVTVPGSISVVIPIDTEKGQYIVRLTGKDVRSAQRIVRFN